MDIARLIMGFRCLDSKALPFVDMVAGIIIVPDLVNYFLAGCRICYRSNVSQLGTVIGGLVILLLFSL